MRRTLRIGGKSVLARAHETPGRCARDPRPASRLPSGIAGLVAALAALAAPESPAFSDDAMSASPISVHARSVLAPRIPTTPRQEAAGVALAPAPLDGSALGFRMQVPVGTTLEIESKPVINFLLASAGEPPSWRMRISPLSASKAETTARTQSAEYLKDLRNRGERFEVIVDEPRRFGDRDGHLFYLAVPLESGGRGITGTLIVPSGPDAYLVFSILALEADFARTRAALDASFATLSFEDVRAVAEGRAALLARGVELFSGFTPEALRATVFEGTRAYRMTKPVDGGPRRDVGYMLVRVREAMAGEVDASRDPASLKGAEREPGLLATVDARMVVNDDPTHVLDVQSRYFMTLDRAAETWSIRSTERHRRASRSRAQTGVRAAPSTGQPVPIVRVMSASLDGTTREPQEYRLPPAYLSQAELIVLGELLPRDLPAGGSIEFMDYAYDQRDEKLPQRRETWSRTADGFRLETRFGSAPAPLVQDFDAAGRRIRRIDLDGTVTELIGLEELRRIWTSKGLPVG